MEEKNQETISQDKEKFLKKFYFGREGMIIDHLLNKKQISTSLMTVARGFKKDPEAKILIKRIKGYLSEEELNENILLILKNKLITKFNSQLR